MSNRIYWVYQLNSNARLGIMARPRGNEWQADEIAHLKQHSLLYLSLFDFY